MLAATFVSCKKMKPLSFFEGHSTWVLSSSTAAQTLKKNNKDNIALVLNGQTLITSSAQVPAHRMWYITCRYNQNFTSAGMQEQAIPKELTTTLTVKTTTVRFQEWNLNQVKKHNVWGRGLNPPFLVEVWLFVFKRKSKIKLTHILIFGEPPGTLAAQYNDGNMGNRRCICIRLAKPPITIWCKPEIYKRLTYCIISWL